MHILKQKPHREEQFPLAAVGMTAITLTLVFSLVYVLRHALGSPHMQLMASWGALSDINSAGHTEDTPVRCLLPHLEKGMAEQYKVCTKCRDRWQRTPEVQKRLAVSDRATHASEHRAEVQGNGHITTSNMASPSICMDSSTQAVS